ncbi:nitroreductase [Pseudomonas fluorescens]|uniref:Nitroreductase n=1 Tax=Pseudomonas fluorescens TaxID=294 RepID=A0A327MSH6_PSEFL|nr:nitroreductase [Pseudomonas fluorescens]RAI64834.1 nitroreductase [Pseudomonas fluorescens]
MYQSRVSVVEAIDTRRSVRAFLPDPIERSVLEAIFSRASRAPSGSNIQPWVVHVLTGDSKIALSRKIVTVLEDPEQNELHHEEFAYYPKTWKSPFIDRRRALGWGLYSLLGIPREDKLAMKAQHARNFEFFDAPVGIVFTTDRTMEQGSWLDFGMFLQNVMLMARTFDLDTCPQAAFNKYHRLISEHLNLPSDQKMVCAMSLGYADNTKVENTLASERVPVEGFVQFHS